jgi:hypothetical protein
MNNDKLDKLRKLTSGAGAGQNVHEGPTAPRRISWQEAYEQRLAAGGADYAGDWNWNALRRLRRRLY